MNINQFEKTAQEMLKRYQSLLKLQLYNIRLIISDDTKSDNLALIIFENGEYTAHLYLYFSKLVDQSAGNGIPLKQLLAETIIHELIHCMFEKREHDSEIILETYINIVSNLIWNYAENPLFPTDHTGKM